MSRAFCIPGIVFLFCALVLNFLVSISLPYLPALDIVRTHFPSSDVTAAGVTGINEVRFGVWAPCYYNGDGDRTCEKTGSAYKIDVGNPKNSQLALVRSSWTRGLVVHPIATGVTLIALLFAFSTHITVTLIASLISFLAALLTLVAFAIDIALYALVHHEMGDLNNNANTNTAPGFWMTLVAFILLLLAGCTVCFGRRRARMSGATTTSTYPTKRRGFFSRFRRT
ncbi:hypothetical protein CPB83DRAFT_869364 [Crepidotus variabilis]|uniref:Pali-domain-containing protein n=1 Tax=Crepidotus variabilis TaxID=179855 RepID=A0A9P6EGX5_9AGAR|nr:hypothetical protein CPB83DRAFT_869364 [Crepidotus variabilis]